MGVALLLLFLAMLTWAGRFLILTSGSPLPETPPEFLDLEMHARATAWVLVIFASTGTVAAIGLIRKWKWGWLLLASFFTVGAAVSALTRFVMPPRYVFHPDWPMVLTLVVFALLAWHKGLRKSQAADA